MYWTFFSSRGIQFLPMQGPIVPKRYPDNQPQPS